MKKKTILSIVALLIVFLAIFGITKFVGAEGKGGGETVVVTHDSGETTVNKNSKRIVVFDFGILDSLDKLNVQGIVGVVQNGLPEHLSKFAGEEYSSIGSLKEPNMEFINKTKERKINQKFQLIFILIFIAIILIIF